VSAFRVVLVVMLVVLAVYTAVVIGTHGINLFPQFFGDRARIGWAGQFNLDFMFMLTLAALWVAWRHAFSGPGLGLAVLAFFGGALFLGTYLLVVTGRAGGDLRVVLLGRERATTGR
jgi:hypothetical protein